MSDLTQIKTVTGVASGFNDTAARQSITELSGAIDYVSANAGTDYYETAVSSTQDFVVAQPDTERTVTGTMTTAYQYGNNYIYTPILSSDLGVDLTKVTFNVDVSSVTSNSQTLNYVGEGITAGYNWSWALEAFKQDLEQPFNTSSTFTGYINITGTPTTLTSISALIFELKDNTTIPYTATYTEQSAPKSLVDLYNAFTAYTASHP